MKGGDKEFELSVSFHQVREAIRSPKREVIAVKQPFLDEILELFGVTSLLFSVHIQGMQNTISLCMIEQTADRGLLANDRNDRGLSLVILDVKLQQARLRATNVRDCS